MNEATQAAMNDKTINDPDFRVLIEKASTAMKTAGGVKALDRACVEVYDILENAVKDTPELLAMTKQGIDSTDVIALVLGWMIGHGGSAGVEVSDRQLATYRLVVLATVASAWSAELNHKYSKRGVN